MCETWLCSPFEKIRDLHATCVELRDVSLSFSFRNQPCAMDMPLRFWDPKYVNDAVHEASLLHQLPAKKPDTCPTRLGAGAEIMVSVFNVDTDQQVQLIMRRDGSITYLRELVGLAWQQNCTLSFKGQAWAESTRVAMMSTGSPHRTPALAVAKGPLSPSHRFFRSPDQTPDYRPKKKTVGKWRLASPTVDNPRGCKVVPSHGVSRRNRTSFNTDDIDYAAARKPSRIPAGDTHTVLGPRPSSRQYRVVDELPSQIDSSSLKRPNAACGDATSPKVRKVPPTCSSPELRVPGAFDSASSEEDSVGPPVSGNSTVDELHSQMDSSRSKRPTDVSSDGVPPRPPSKVRKTFPTCSPSGARIPGVLIL